MEKNSNQSRFLTAAVLSLLVLTAWTYFFAPERPPEQANANTQAANTNSKPDPTVSQTPESKPEASESADAQTPDETPNKKITIKTPLYEATIDSQGAVATSWILVLNDSESADDRKPLFAQGSTKDKKKPLELVSKRGLEHKDRLAGQYRDRSFCKSAQLLGGRRTRHI